MALPPSIDLWDGYGHSDGTQYGGNAATIQSKANRISVFIEQGTGYGFEGLAYKNAGFRGPVTTYKLHIQVQRNRSPGYWSGNQFIRDQAQFDALTPECFLYRSQAEALAGDPAGRLYYTTDYGVPFAFVDPDATKVQNLLGDETAWTIQNQPGTDAVFLDNINHNLENPSKKSSTGQVWSGRGERYTNDTFRGAVRRCLAAMRVRAFNIMGVQPIMGGNLIGQTYGSSSTQNVKLTEWVELDFIFDESPYGYPWTDPPALWSASRMDYIIGQMRDFLALGNERFLMLAGQSDTTYKNDVQNMRYTLGIAMLVRPSVRTFTKNGRTIPYVSQRFTNARAYGDNWEYADTDVNLGDPTGPAVKVGLEWVRPFTNGELRVNTTTRGVQFNVGAIPPPTGGGPYGVRSVWAASEPMGVERTASHGPDVQAGDAMFGIVLTRDARNNPTFADWAPLGSPIRSGTGISAHVFYKRAVEADAGANKFYQVDLTHDTASTVIVLAYPGIHTTPLDLLSGTVNPAFAGVVGSGTKVTAPSLKPENTAVQVAVHVMAWGYADVTIPQGMNRRHFERTSDVPLTIMVSDQQVAADTDTGAREVTTSATGTHIAFSFALRLAAATPVAGPPSIVLNASSQPAVTRVSYNDPVDTGLVKTITPDAAVQVGDLMLVHIANRNSGSVAQIPVTLSGSNWVETVAPVHRNNSQSGRLYHKYRLAGETDGYTVTVGNSIDFEVTMIPIRNAHPTDPVPAGAAASSSNTNAGAVPQPVVHPAVTGMINSLHLLLGQIAGSFASFTPPNADYTEISDYGVTDVGITSFASYRILPAAGPTSALSSTTNSFTGSNIGFSVAVRPVDAAVLPAKPVLSQSVTEGVLTLSWPVLAAATSVRVERSTNDGPYVPVTNGGTLPGGATSVQYALPPGTYKHRIYGANDAGSGPVSDPVTTTITGIQTVTTVLEAKGVRITWTPETFVEGEIRIERSHNAGTSWELVRQSPSAVLPLGQLVDTGGVPGQTYRHRVAAVVGGQNTGWVTSSDVTLPALPPPTTPPIDVYQPAQLPAVAAVVHNEYHSLTDGSLATMVSHSGISDHPERHGRKITAPYQDGTNDLGFVLDARTFQIAFNLTGRTGEEVAAKKQELLDLLEPSDRPTTLRFDMVSGGVYLIDAHFKTMSSGTVTKEGDYVLRVVVTFEADDPAFRELDQVTVPFQFSISNNGFTVPLPIPLSVGVSTLDVTTPITYTGHSYARPVISIEGPVTGLVIANETLGTGIVFKPDYTIPEGSSVTIDTRRGYIEVVDQDGIDITDVLADESELASFVLASRKFVKGGINQVRVSGVGASPLTRVFLTYAVRRLAIT
jgi:hypothetical protein